MNLSDTPFAEKKFMTVNGQRMAYIDEGEGDAIVFSHGYPTSSYLWRNIMPACRGLGRLVACDLIGQGDSDKLPKSDPDRYGYFEQRSFIHALWDQLDLGDNIIFVVHDWGSALGFSWAQRHPERVKAIVYMEAIVRPVASWDEWSPSATPIFQGFRSEKGETMILERNMFIERVLPGSILRKLTEAEMTEYRRPFLQAPDRWPMLTWPRQIPIAGEPAEVVRIAADYSRWMAENDLPKLFVNAEPGAILIGALRDFCRSWNNQTEVTVPGSHFIQEDSGPAIGRAVANWIKANGL